MNHPDSKRKKNFFQTGPARAAISVVVTGIALILLSSAFITAYHFHQNLEKRPDCAVCKSAGDLSSGDVQGGIEPIPHALVQTASVITHILFVSAIFDCSPSNRAPPV